MSATRLPAFQFYPGDWRKDPDLQRCTKAEKGFFIDALCLTHECEFRGAFFGNGSAWTREEIADGVGGDRSENLGLLSGLLTKGPLKVWSKVASKVGLNTSRIDLCPDLPEGTIYSRRMLRDEIKRIACSDAGSKGGGNPGLKSKQTFKGLSKGGPKGTPKGLPKGKVGSSSSSSDNKIPENGAEAFETFRKAYPGRKRGGEVEYAHFLTKHKERAAEILPLLLPAAKAYAARCEKESIELRFRKHLDTWINNECWTEESPIAALSEMRPRHQTEPDSNLSDWELAQQEAGHG